MESLQTVQIYVASNYTIRPVKRVISYWMQKQGVSSNCIFSESYQFISQLYDTGSNFYNKEVYVSLIFFRFENCFAAVDSDELDLVQCKQFFLDFKNSLNFAMSNGAGPIIIIESPLTKKAKDEDKEGIIASLRVELMQVAAKLQGIYFEAQDSLLDLYPMDDYHGDLSYSGALMPYTNECYTALGSIASRKISALVRNPKKVVVLDCDNTLWRGVAAEDGAAALVVDENYVWLQTFMVCLYERGVLLCLCSKNVEQDIWDAFNYLNVSMPLKKEHFIATRINWECKSKNIFSLSKELNLGLESFIFLDDNPIEINEVKTAFPIIECIQVPHDSSKILNLIKHQWVFDLPHVYDSDRNRAEYYQRENERKSIESNYKDYDQFLEHLNLELKIEELTEDTVGRASQLTIRTNQFNFSGLKLTNLEISQRINNSSFKCSLVTARDRFGDYGEIGCLLYRITHDSIILENFLLSCRALGKKMEYRIWDWLLDFSSGYEVNSIEIVFTETPRNQPAYNFLTSLGLIDTSFDGKIIRYVMPHISR